MTKEDHIHRRKVHGNMFDSTTSKSKIKDIKKYLFLKSVA